MRKGKQPIKQNSYTEFLLYTTPNGKVIVEIFLHNENIWLTQARIAELFGVDRSVVTKHLQNIFKEGELDKKSTSAKIAQDENTIEQTLEMAQNLGLNVRSPDVVRPSGRAQETNITPSVDTLLKYGLIAKPNFSTDQDSFHRNQLYHTCLAGKIAVTTDGQVIPCIFSRNDILGSLKNQKLTDILELPDTEEMWGLTKDKVLVCKDCEYRYACSDCRPLAEGSTCGKGYSNAPFPRCTYNPYTGEWGSGVWKMDNNEEAIYEELIQN